MLIVVQPGHHTDRRDMITGILKLEDAAIIMAVGQDIIALNSTPQEDIISREDIGGTGYVKNAMMPITALVGSFINPLKTIMVIKNGIQRKKCHVVAVFDE